MAQKAKRPRVAHSHTLPDDVVSLEAYFVRVYREVNAVLAHLENEFHDFQARRRLVVLFEDRARAWAKLYSLAPNVALRLAAHYQLVIPEVV